MTPERWQQIEEVFQAAVERPPEERLAFLDQVCADDPELRREVESLLSQDNDQDTFITTVISAAAESLSVAQTHDMIGRRIGAYRVTSLVGQGGMAEVFCAIRDDDQYRKQVAIKLVKRGMLTDFMLSRFRHERQILANLEHPNIARLLEGGTTEDHLPYFVMEYIEGQSITEYCDANNLSIRERLRLFRQVCQAVQQAHRNLIVHRDLKPSNILVTREGTPKLLDFGIAKLLNPELASEAITVAQTMTAMRLMTPDYASPEQVRGEPVTTATDIYSLGAILYELLTGQRPHQLKDHSIVEIERVICQTEPEKPSTAISNPKSKIQNPKLKRQLAGDLDNIVLMAMRKEPERRYQSVEQFSEDIRRYLEGHPVQARADALGYRVSKFVRRHKVAVSFAATLLVILVGFAVTMTVQATRIARERDRANREAATAEQVTEFLVGLFEVSDPNEAKGQTVTAKEVLDRGAERISNELADQPLTQARLMKTIGKVYMNLGLYDQATPLLEKALDLRRTTQEDDHLDMVATLTDLADLYRRQGDYAKAESFYQRAVTIQEKALGPSHPDVAANLRNLATSYTDQGKFAEAEPLYQRSLTILEKNWGPDHEEVAKTLEELGSLYRRQGKYQEAEPLFQRSLTILEKTLGPEHPEMGLSIRRLATLYRLQWKYNEAEALYKKALPIVEKTLGPEHRELAGVLKEFADVYRRQKKYDEAQPLYERALSIMEKTLGPEHPDVAVTLNSLALLHKDQKHYDEAEPLFLRSRAILEKTLGPEHPNVALSTHNIADFYKERRKYPEAERLYKQSRAILEKTLGPEHPHVARSFHSLATLYSAQGRFAEAEPLFQRSLAIGEKALGPEHPSLVQTLEDYAALLRKTGRAPKASAFEAQAQAIRANQSEEK